MKKVFVADDNFSRGFIRSLAKGHTGLVIGDDVNVFDPVTFKTVGTDLVIEKAGDSEEEEVYTILCKEFGLVGMEKDFKSKISVIFLDDGYMLVTLHKGALVLRLNEKLMMPSVGVDSVPPVSPDEVLWINADYILGFKKYWELKGQFIYDFELVLEIKGSRAGGMHNFGLVLIPEECIDLSLGYVAQYEQRIKSKEEAKAAQKFASQFLQPSEPVSYDFDDDEDEDDEYDEDDEDVDDLYGF